MSKDLRIHIPTVLNNAYKPTWANIPWACRWRERPRAGADLYSVHVCWGQWPQTDDSSRPGGDVAMPKTAISQQKHQWTMSRQFTQFIHIQGGSRKVKPTTILLVTFEWVGKIQWFLADVNCIQQEVVRCKFYANFVIINTWHARWRHIRATQHWNYWPMGVNDPKIHPFHLRHLDPHLTHECLGWLHSPS